MGDEPAWGTPEHTPAPGRTPDGKLPQRYDPRRPPELVMPTTRPRDSSPPSLLGQAELVLRERSGMAGGGYELATAQGVPLGAVRRTPNPAGWLFGKVATDTYTLLDRGGRPLASITRPGGFGTMTFTVARPDGRPVGRIEQENLVMAPQLSLTAADGGSARLVGGALGSFGERDLVGPGDRALGRVSTRNGLGSFFAGTDIYLIELDAGLTGDLRLLAVLATACVDIVLNSKRRGRGSVGISFGG